MRTTRALPDDVIEAIVHDQPVDPSFAPLLAFAHHVRALGDGSAPRPSSELAALLEGRTKPVLDPVDAAHLHSAGTERRSGATRLTRITTRVAGLGLVAKIALGTSLAAASVAGAGAAGVLPATANDAVRHALEAVSPAEFTDTDDEPIPADDGRHPAATGATDDDEGNDTGEGPANADDAPRADHRPDPATADEPPGQPGETGLTQANETPAAPHAPDTTPAATAPSTTPVHTPPDPGRASPPQSAPSTVPPHGGQADDHIPDP